MQPHHIEEDENGDILICDRSGREIVRFNGQDALQQAVEWAHGEGLRLYANINPHDLTDFYNVYNRRRPRFLRLYRFRTTPLENADPPNVKRVIIPNLEEYIEEMAGEEGLEPHSDDDPPPTLIPWTDDDADDDA